VLKVRPQPKGQSQNFAAADAAAAAAAAAAAPSAAVTGPEAKLIPANVSAHKNKIKEKMAELRSSKKYSGIVDNL
jgi:hypothetical protein